MSSLFSHSGSDRPTSIVAAEPSARPTSYRNVSSSAAVAMELHFVGAASSSSAGVPQRPAASAALFDFDSTVASDAGGNTNAGVVGSGAGTSGVNHPASVSVTPITATPVMPNGPERPPPTGAGGGGGSGDLPAPPTNNMDLVSLFECPVCMDFALPPILQCQSGHIVCASCRSKLSSCPTCRGNLGKSCLIPHSNVFYKLPLFTFLCHYANLVVILT